MLLLILTLYEIGSPTSIFAVNLDHQRSTHPFNWKMTGTFYFEKKKKISSSKNRFFGVGVGFVNRLPRPTL
jgi:hypothetical protein